MRSSADRALAFDYSSGNSLSGYISTRRWHYMDSQKASKSCGKVDFRFVVTDRCLCSSR